MRLVTVAGRYAGEERDYPFLAGRAALSAGTARRPDEPQGSLTESSRPPVTVASASKRADKSKR